MAAEPLLLSSTQAAEFLGISRTTFYSMLSAGEVGPVPIEVRSRRMFRRADIEQWVAAGCPSRATWMRELVSDSTSCERSIGGSYNVL